jgi:hypothetical protein
LLRFDDSLVDKKLIVMYGIFSVLLALNNSICVLSNGTSNLHPQVNFYVLAFIIILPAKILVLNLLGVYEMIFLVNMLLLIILIPFYINVQKEAFK